MNHGCNKSLNVFQLAPPLSYNNGVCQYKWGVVSHSYTFGTIFSDWDFFNFAD
jgi:hypothetical protein